MLRRAVAAAVLVLVFALAAGCTASSEEVRPPADQLDFPTGLAVSPDESVLFVVGANSELRYDSGTVLAIDLARVDDIADAWVADPAAIPEDCDPDPTFSETLSCEESLFLIEAAGVRIGNFATRVGLQDLGGGALRLVVPVRGDPSITTIDWDPGASVLRCGEGDGFPLCDDEHRLSRFAADDDEQIEDEPYDVFVDSFGEWAMTTHLSSGTVTLADLPAGGSPALADVLGGLFAADATGRRGSVGIAGRTPGQPDDIVYVGSLSESRIQTFTVARPGTGSPLLVPGAYFFLDSVGELGGASSDTRAIAFGQGGDVGYFMNREPPSVTVVDTSIGPTGTPRNVIAGATDICREASALAVADVGDGERAFVSCFQSGQLYVVDPRAGVEVEAITQIGRGPFGVAAAPGRARLYVANFFENTIAVVELAPGETQYRVVLRIGIPTT
jgi:DNA-binding beta-propeller fold protein YncE/CDGSH-type Zn-finger protein